MNKRTIVLFAWALAVLVLLAACGNGAKGGNAADKEGAGNEGGAPRETRNEINVALTAQPPTLDTAMTVSQVALDVGQHIFEQLYTLNADYEPTPMLAESVDVSEDGLTYTFYLRKGVKFHNGEEMTAEDVEASMNRWLVTSSRAKVLLSGASFTAVDDYTVELALAEPSSDVLILIGSQANFPAIMPKEIVEAAPPEGVAEYIGTGPYKLREWRQDQYIHLVRFDEYASVDGEPSGFAGRKKAPTEHLYFHFVQDHSTRIAGIKTGLYDIALSIPNENYDELAVEPDIELLTFPGGTLTAFFNTREGVLGTNPALRQAVLAALNNEEIMLASYVRPEVYTLAPGYMNPNQVQWHTDAGGELYNQANPEKAKELLAEAGYQGEEITLLTTKDYNEMYTGTLVIQDQLRQIGMNVKVDNFDFPTFLERKNDRSTWDLFLASTGYQLIPPQILAVNPDWHGLDDQRVKDGLAAIRAAASPDAAKAEWEALQGYLYEIASSTVLGHYNELVAVSAAFDGFELFESPVLWNARIEK